MTDYITVRNWDKFQHADVAKNKIRAPSWIRVYTELLSDEAFLGLTEHRRLVLVCLWLEYARTRARLPLDTRSLTRRLQVRVTTADLTALKQAGYVEFPHDSLTTVSGPKETRGEKTRAVLTALPGGAEPDDADSLGNTFEDILKEIV